MKKIIAFSLTILLIMTSFTGCFFKDKQSEFEKVLTADTTAIYNQLLQKVPDPTDIKAMNAYLQSWAIDHNIPVSYDEHQNIIMSKKATESYEDAESTILQCAIGQGIAEEQYQAIASALYLIDKVEKHGFIRVLFTANQNNDMKGAEDLSKNYLNADNLINLTHAGKTSFTIGSAGTSQYDFSKQLNWQAPTYPHAYEISIRNLNGGSSGILLGKHPNPIKIIGDFLASSKSNGVLIELGGFNGGQSVEEYPIEATAVVLINDSDVARFQKYFDTAASKFADKYQNSEENYTYTLTPIPSPPMVISKDDSTKVLSLLYTMINGIYFKSDDGEVIAASNIGTIRTTTGNLDVSICSRSLDQSILNEMAATFGVICGLNDVNNDVLDGFPIWNVEKSNPLLTRLTDLFEKDYNKKIECQNTFERTECAIFKQKNEKLNILSMSINFENDLTEIEALYQFLENIKATQTTKES
ncbi:hypothetical protein [Clostridium aminobutyricum]|uniref:Uncharacterized protein n=1 Tax=Clostridium aminobutyricum TaxID=33953 RepID=A0A939D8C4_CLOAM|nr:hypothetical protein [Clostridium aminobutyricum]MBN7772578.1 hypothetical protein [Clostridium aminobutyricum]